MACTERRFSAQQPAIALVNEFESQRFSINPIDGPNFATDIYELRSLRQTLSAAAEHFINMLEISLCNAPALPAAAGQD